MRRWLQEPWCWGASGALVLSRCRLVCDFVLLTSQSLYTFYLCFKGSLYLLCSLMLAYADVHGKKPGNRNR